MDYDVIFLLGDVFFDHPLCGVALLKRLLEKYGYKVGVIEKPTYEEDVMRLGKPKLFFGISSGAVDSMVRNYTPLKKLRSEDKYSDETGGVDRCVTVYSNWVRKLSKDSKIIIGGTESTLRRFVHYDYWQNRLRKSILLDTRADLLVYGNGEKQILEICNRLKAGESLEGIEGTCIIRKELPTEFVLLPGEEEVLKSKEKFVDMQNMLCNYQNLAQKTGNRFVLQFKFPKYTSKDLDEYYELPYTRAIPKCHLRGFEFSVVTHRGCIGNCNFCALRLIQGDKIISRSEESILREIASFVDNTHYRGNIDDFGGPSANMYGMDCGKCNKDCIDCKALNKSHSRLMKLMEKARKVPGVNNIYIRSGIRYDLAPKEYIQEICKHHIFDTLRIAPEHINKKVLKCMNKDYGSLTDFIKFFNSLNSGKKLSYYFISAHPGATIQDATELAKKLKGWKNVSLQTFTPTPMSNSTCMYYTGLDIKTKKKISVPYTYSEKKEMKRVVMKELEN